MHLIALSKWPDWWCSNACHFSIRWTTSNQCVYKYLMFMDIRHPRHTLVRWPSDKLTSQQNLSQGVHCTTICTSHKMTEHNMTIYDFCWDTEFTIEISRPNFMQFYFSKMHLVWGWSAVMWLAEVLLDLERSLDTVLLKNRQGNSRGEINLILGPEWHGIDTMGVQQAHHSSDKKNKNHLKFILCF